MPPKRARASTTTTLPATKKRKTATAVEPYATPTQPTSRKKKAQVPATLNGVYTLPSQPYTQPYTQAQPKVKANAKPKSTPMSTQATSSPPEKRAARFKPNCPQATMERVSRVMTQRFFMIDRTRKAAGALEEEFKVLGSTGNVYTVVISQIPRCDCPDATKGNHCKHILFIFLKVLQVPQSSNVWYQKALLPSELLDIFSNAPLAPNSVQHPQIRAAYERATGKSTHPSSTSSNASHAANTSTGASDATGQRQRKTLGLEDDCPICYDGMNGMKEPKVVWCDECGNAVHKECFEQWKRTARSSGKPLTCVYCRAQIHGPLGEASSSSSSRGGMYAASDGIYGGGDEEGYLNLANQVGLSTVRDTSSYHDSQARRYQYGRSGRAWARDYDDDDGGDGYGNPSRGYGGSRRYGGYGGGFW